MEKIIAKNLKASPNQATKNPEKIEEKNYDFSSLKVELEEEQRENDLVLVDGASDLVKSDPSLITGIDSESMDYTATSDSSWLSYFDWDEWALSSVNPIYSPISSVKPEIFKMTLEETKPTEYNPYKMLGVGMFNLGNTCYLSAVMQCFMHTVVLLQLLASIDHVSQCETYMNGFCVICIIREIVDVSMFGDFLYVSPRKIVSHLRDFSSNFVRHQQQDAHEFLQCFLNKLESCCNNLEPKDTVPVNIVKEAFGGRLVSKLRCCNCSHCSITYEPLVDLSLEINDVDSVPAALESFTRIEKLEFSCERCKVGVSGEKQLLVDQAPSVATLHLKRFKNDGCVVQKVNKHVSFPLELDLLPYTNDIHNVEMKYDLYAVIVHAGFSPSSGHYYSFIRCAPNEWYKYDDKQVLRVHKDLVLAEEAYIMFYAKRGTPWFSDYIQIHTPFIDPAIIYKSNLPDVGESNDATNKTSSKPELDKIVLMSSTPRPEICRYYTTNQVYCKDQSQDVEIKQAHSRDEELMDTLHSGSHNESYMNKKKRKMEDSPSRDDTSSSYYTSSSDDTSSSYYTSSSDDTSSSYYTSSSDDTSYMYIP